MNIQTIEYHKVFNLGNYSNEKIGITIALADGESTLDAFAEAKKVVEKSHLFFTQLPDYEKAQAVVNNTSDYTGRQVDASREFIKAFEANYPDYMAKFIPANRTLVQGEYGGDDRDMGHDY